MNAGSDATINEIAQIFAEACEQIINQATNSQISTAPTMQKVPSVFLKPDIGCFVQFNGDYSGLFIMNFSGPVALEIYRKSMLFMGMPEDELASEHTSDEVVDSIGELINQIMGKARSIIKQRFGLSATNPQPKAICISSVITMAIAAPLNRPQCRRIAFRSAENHAFHVEISMEETEFIPINRNSAENDDETVTNRTENDDIDDIINGL
ncbi:MAG: DUF3334 domain-containing protein [Deltaproteobacteria bacterium]|nr:MAG: DUF3334 domain-containing protein [Deltaproteobacteria bacterium]